MGLIDVACNSQHFLCVKSLGTAPGHILHTDRCINNQHLYVKQLTCGQVRGLVQPPVQLSNCSSHP